MNKAYIALTNKTYYAIMHSHEIVSKIWAKRIIIGTKRINFKSDNPGWFTKFFGALVWIMCS